MFINKLEIKNFRWINENCFEFKKAFTVIAGNGKTTLMDAICVSLGGWLYAFDGLDRKDKRNIMKDDIRVLKDKISGSLIEQFPVIVYCNVTLFGKNIRLFRSLKSRNGKATYEGISEISKIALYCNNKIYEADDENIILPLVVYYSDKRVWNEDIQKENKFKRDKIRLEGYKNSIYFSNSMKNTMDFIDKLAYEGYKNENISCKNKIELILNVIKDSLKPIIGSSEIMYNLKSNELNIADKSNRVKAYSQLSDEFRCAISLILDICCRMMMLNPQLQADVVLRMPGVVLIDEIELYMSPKMQKSIVERLKLNFPGIQFIVTTRSDFIIESLTKDELIYIKSE